MNRPLDPLDLLERSGLDLSTPFTSQVARAAGLESKHLLRLVEHGLLRRPLRGVYYGAHLEDTLELRVACVRLAVPEDGVVTDRTAGWLHGSAMVLAPNDHLVVPAVSVFQGSSKRLRNDVTASGERRLSDRDVVEVHGLRTTTPLRTACDLGRLLRRDAAFAALDAMTRLGRFTVDDLVVEAERFRGYRGVRQLRALAPLADPGAESFGESVLRLRWYDAGAFPRPETQIPILKPEMSLMARLDLGCRAWRYAAEYDGAAFHGPDQEDHDRARRAWIADEGWTVEVYRRDDVFGPRQNASARLAKGLRLAALRTRHTR
jgi:hypothetical protein